MKPRSGPVGRARYNPPIVAIALSVVIPAYNEEARLGASLESVLAYLELRFGLAERYEVVVVDDGSSDQTAAVARRYPVTLIEQQPNVGKGAALRRGVMASRGGQVLLTDADMSTPIAELARLEPFLAVAPLVLGSRAASGARITERQPRYREWMGRVFNRLVQLLAVGGIRDTQCGFKLLDGVVARRLFAELTIERFAYDVELVFLARRAGLEVVEVGVEWQNSADSRVHPLRDSPKMLLDILRMRWRHMGRAPRQ